MPATLDLPSATRRQFFSKLTQVTRGAAEQGMRRPGKAQLLDQHAPSADPLATSPPALVRWLTKASYGYSRATHDELMALGSSDDARWAAWVNQQLAPQNLPDQQCETRINEGGFITLNKSLSQLWAEHVRDVTGPTRVLPVNETEAATIIRAVYSKRQLYERTVNFWHDHFNVFGREYSIAPVFVHYDRDVIRPHALGNFRDMLESVAKSTAMQLYLDNYASRGADFNENYARELIELHTLGVENYFGPTDPFSVPCLATDIHCPGELPAGYVDNDVYEAAAALTGWTIRNGRWPYPEEDDGSFTYRANWHDRRNKIFLGHYIPPNHQPAMEDGHVIFDRLINHPGTAAHIAKKMCRRFIGDTPSQVLVDSVATAFINHLESPDQIARMLRLILNSSEFKQSWGNSMRRPFETTMGSLRTLEANVRPKLEQGVWNIWSSFVSRLAQTGHQPFSWSPPDGYPDSQRAWSSTGSLAMTMKLLAFLPEALVVEDGDRIASVVDDTLAAFPQAQRSAANIIDYWCDRLFGWRPPVAHAVALDLMRQNAADDEALNIHENVWNGVDLKHHRSQERLRTAVSMLLMAPENFHR